MENNQMEKIKTNENFKKLIAARSRLGWQLSAIIVGLYFAFIIVIAFAPDVLGTPIATGSITTIGIPVGIFIIVTAFVLTGIYVARANSEFDGLVRKILEETE